MTFSKQQACSIFKIKFLFMLCWTGIYSPFKNYRLGALATCADNQLYWLTTEMVETSSTSVCEHENVTFNYMVDLAECQRQTTGAITSAFDTAWEFSISAYFPSQKLSWAETVKERELDSF